MICTYSYSARGVPFLVFGMVGVQMELLNRKLLDQLLRKEHTISTVFTQRPGGVHQGLRFVQEEKVVGI